MFRFLVLTDHTNHTDQNSLYALVSCIANHHNCQYIDIASRGNPANDLFFYALNWKSLHVCRASEIFSFQENGHPQFFEDLKITSPDEYDVILMRLPRPTTDEFLKFIHENRKNIPVFNDPVGILNTSTKSYLVNFQKYCPPMKVCYSIADVQEFVRSEKAIVLKPLREYGGKGILKIQNGVLNDGQKDHNALSYLNSIEQEQWLRGYLAMRFLTNVSKGDKRIIVAGGEALAATLRLPRPGSWLCNVARGGSSVAAEIDMDEWEIVKFVSSCLEQEGIFLFGLDTLVDDDGRRVLSEINTLSVGGLPQAEKQTGKPIVKIVVDKLFEKIHSHA